METTKRKIDDQASSETLHKKIATSSSATDGQDTPTITVTAVANNDNKATGSVDVTPPSPRPSTVISSPRLSFSAASPPTPPLSLHGHLLTPLTHYMSSHPGKKRYQQDMPLIVPDLQVVNPELKDTRYSYYAVYDGHGGHFCSRWLQQELHIALASALVTQLQPFNLKKTPTPEEEKGIQIAIQKAFQESFKAIDNTLLEECRVHKQDDGSCSISVLVRGDVCWVANVGDSKAVLGREKTCGTETTVRPISLSEDHSPLLVKERERIQKAGGKVEDGRVNGRLGVSRSFGDRPVKKAGVICFPDIKKFTITPADKFMILACDGLWEVFTLQDCIDYVSKAIAEQWERVKEEEEKNRGQPKSTESHVQTVCRRTTEKLLREAVLLRGAKDNVTVILVLFGSGR